MIKIIEKDKFIKVVNKHLNKIANEHGFRLSELITDKDKEECLNYINSLDPLNEDNQIEHYSNIANYIKSLLNNKIQLALKT